MENSELVLCDTDVIIEFYKGNFAITESLKKLELEILQLVQSQQLN